MPQDVSGDPLPVAHFPDRLPEHDPQAVNTIPLAVDRPAVGSLGSHMNRILQGLAEAVVGGKPCFPEGITPARPGKAVRISCSIYFIVHDS